MALIQNCSNYNIIKVDGQKHAEEIQRFNGLFKKDFLPLKPKHLAKGFWWLVYHGVETVAFAGVVPFDPFPRVGYFKRVAVLPGEHRGCGLQKQLMETLEAEVRISTDWTHIVSDTHRDNIASANNFIRSGYVLCEYERWEKDFLIWKKTL